MRLFTRWASLLFASGGKGTAVQTDEQSGDKCDKGQEALSEVRLTGRAVTHVTKAKRPCWKCRLTRRAVTHVTDLKEFSFWQLQNSNAIILVYALGRCNQTCILQGGIVRKLNQHLGLAPTLVDGEIGETVWATMMQWDSSLTAKEVASKVINRFQLQEAGGNL